MRTTTTMATKLMHWGEKLVLKHHVSVCAATYLCAKNRRVAICKDGKIVAFDVEESEDEVSPAILDYDVDPTTKAVLIQRV